MNYKAKMKIKLWVHYECLDDFYDAYKDLQQSGFLYGKLDIPIHTTTPLDKMYYSEVHIDYSDYQLLKSYL